MSLHSITISITSHQIPKAGHCPCWNSNGSACALKDYCNRRYQMSSKTPFIRNYFSFCYSRTKKQPPPHILPFQCLKLLLLKIWPQSLHTSSKSAANLTKWGKKSTFLFATPVFGQNSIWIFGWS